MAIKASNSSGPYYAGTLNYDAGVGPPPDVNEGIESAQIGADGITITLVFVEAQNLKTSSLLLSGFNVGNRTLTYVSGDGTTTWVLTLSSSAYMGSSYNLVYTDNENGLENLEGTALPNFSQSVVNNSTTPLPIEIQPEDMRVSYKVTSGITSSITGTITANIIFTKDK